MYEIKLKDIPTGLLPAIGSNKYATLWLNKTTKIKNIFFRNDQYRVVTASGEYRYDLDTDIDIEIYIAQEGLKMRKGKAIKKADRLHKINRNICYSVKNVVRYLLFYT